jgi:hypothetical protein
MRGVKKNAGLLTMVNNAACYTINASILVMIVCCGVCGIMSDEG